jgi:hypothetical protein
MMYMKLSGGKHAPIFSLISGATQCDRQNTTDCGPIRIGDLKPVDPVRGPSRQASKPAKESVDVEVVREHLANAQHSSVDQFSGDIAILKKYLKSKGVHGGALDELDSLCEDMEKRWNAAVETISGLPEDE